MKKREPEPPKPVAPPDALSPGDAERLSGAIGRVRALEALVNELDGDGRIRGALNVLAVRVRELDAEKTRIVSKYAIRDGDNIMLDEEGRIARAAPR